MDTSNRVFSLGFAFLAAAVATAGWGRSARADAVAEGLAVAKKADAANAGFKSETSTLKMDLINAHGDVTERKMVIETLEGTDDGDRSRAVFEWPADVKGTKLLTFTHRKGDDDQWLYLPAIKRVKRISSNNKSGSFMASEFAYEDLGSQEVEKYTYKLLSEEKLEGRDTWKIERVPLDKKSGYKRQVVWMDKQYMNPLRIDYYDRKDELLKTAVFSQYQKFGKYWRAGKIDMRNAQTKKRSVLTWEKRSLGAKLDPAVFESTALEE